MLLIMANFEGVDMKRVSLSLVLLSTIVTGCASKQSVLDNSEPHVVNNVVISEPLNVDYKSELAIAKLTQIISHAKLEKEKLAELLYDRGVMYDSLGLRSLAQLDFRRALEHKPDFADAYNFIGIHLTLMGQYAQAFEAFDSALEIDPEHQYVHLNRGIALHYYGRNGLAMEDLETFYVKKPDDPYRVIWLYFSEVENDAEGAKLRLIYNASQLNPNSWSYQIVELLLGNLTEQTFINNMGKNLKSSRELVERLCEGYFYLAKFKLAMGDEEAAKNYFRLALGTSVHEFVEHKYSRLELNKLYEIARQRYANVEASQETN